MGAIRARDINKIDRTSLPFTCVLDKRTNNNNTKCHSHRNWFDLTSEKCNEMRCQLPNRTMRTVQRIFEYIVACDKKKRLRKSMSLRHTDARCFEYTVFMEISWLLEMVRRLIDFPWRDYHTVCSVWMWTCGDTDARSFAHLRQFDANKWNWIARHRRHRHVCNILKWILRGRKWKWWWLCSEQFGTIFFVAPLGATTNRWRVNSLRAFFLLLSIPSWFL